ncbi:MAG: hypothetical protein AABX70_08920 [Nanoarchaeota archaeon]
MPTSLDAYIEAHSRPNGDMAHYRAQQAPVSLRLCSWIFPEGNCEESLDRGSRWVENITAQDVCRWVAHTNDLFRYLSKGSFSLVLEEITTHPLELPIDFADFKEFLKGRPALLSGTGFNVVVGVDELRMSQRRKGSYLGKGLVFVNYTAFHEGEIVFPHPGYDMTGMHEIMHGLIGFDHCQSQNCLMEGARDVLGVEDMPRNDALRLCKEDREALGWPYKKPLRFWP